MGVELDRTAVPGPAVTGKRPLGAGGLNPVLAARVRPTSPRRDQVLPVVAPLAPLLPDGVLQRGTVLAVSATAGAGGATTLGAALAAAATAAGSWAAVVGAEDLGLAAVAELGMAVDRLLLVPRPGLRWAEVVAVLAEGVDVVVLRTPPAVGAAVARRLATRVRDRRTVLVAVGGRRPWPEADLRLEVAAADWTGLGAGHGHLAGRRARVTAVGRRAAGRPREVDLWLPAATGAVAAVG